MPHCFTSFVGWVVERYARRWIYQGQSDFGPLSPGALSADGEIEETREEREVLQRNSGALEPQRQHTTQRRLFRARGCRCT